MAGCGQAIDYSRLALWRVLEATHEANRPRELSTWVDDLGHHEQGREQEVRAKVTGVAKCLHGLLQERGFELSAKSVILSNPPRLAQEIARDLAKAGIQLVATRAAKDLGLDAHVGRRSTTVQQGRIKKAQKRASSIKELVKVQRETKALARTGFKPQATWGPEAQGLAPTTLRRLRTQGRGMSGSQYPGAAPQQPQDCRTTRTPIPSYTAACSSYGSGCTSWASWSPR